MSGKGSRQRPRLVSTEKFSDSWDRIFSKKTKQEEKPQIVNLYDDLEDVDVRQQEKISQDRYPLG